MMKLSFRTAWPAGAILLLAFTPRASVAQANNHSGSVNSQKRAGLDQKIAVRPGYWRISRLMAGLQTSSGLEIARGDSVPDDPGFFASRSIPLRILMNQLRLLMTDQKWSYHWAAKSVPGSATRYVFSRVQLTPAEQQAAAIRVAHGRIDRIIDALPEIEKGANPDVDSDPDLGVFLGGDSMQSQYAFLSELPPAEIDGLLAGNKLVLPVAQMSPADQALVMRAAAGLGMMAMKDNITGVTRVTFDRRNILTQGRVEIKGEHGGPGGGPSLDFLIFSQLEGGTASGAEMLYPHLANDPRTREYRAEHAVRDQQPFDEELMRLIPGAKPVTIDAAMPLKKDEPAFAAYLRSFVDQTGLTLIAYWPKDAKAPQQRMEQSINQQPAAEALDALCRAYDCKWVLDQKVIRIRVPEPTKAEAKNSGPSSRPASSIRQGATEAGSSIIQAGASTIHK